MGTTDNYKYKDGLRVCDICGVNYHKSELQRIGPLRWACPDDAAGLTAEQIARHNANVRPLTVKAVKNPRPPTQVPTYQVAEADILNLVLKYAPQQVFLAESGDFGANLDTVTGLDSSRTAGWMAFYLGNLALENKRPTRWIASATAACLSLADNILLRQFGPTTFTTDPHCGGIGPNVIPFGGIYYANPPLPVDGTISLPIDTHGTAVCLMALLRAFQLSGLTKYRDGARNCATFLRRAQCIGSYANTWAQANPSGARLAPGPFPATVTWDFDDNNPSAVPSSYRFLADGLICAWALNELLGVDGDKVYGDTQATINANDFSLPTASTLSGAIQACIGWWTNGQLDGVTNTVIIGLSASTPRGGFLARSNPSGLASQWLVGSIGSFGFSLALRSLWEIGGYTAKVSEVYSWLRGGSANAANQAPASWTPQQVQKSLRGIYDPNLCLATFVDANASDVTGQGYDWRTVGLLAPIQSSRDSGSLGDAKDTLSVLRMRSWRMRLSPFGAPLNAAGGASTVEGAQFFRDLDTRDDPRLLTQTGLSMQTSVGIGRSDWTGGLTNGHYIDLQGAVQCADCYRYFPGRFPLAQG